MKQCTKCEQWKNENEFEIRVDINKYRRQCKLCVKNSVLNRCNHKKPIILEKCCDGCKLTKSVKEFNKDKYSKCGFTSLCKDCKKKYNNTHRDEILIQHKKYYYNNLEDVRNYIKLWNSENKDKVNKQKSEYNKIKRKIDANFHIIEITRTRLRCVLRGNKKHFHTVDLLGCSVQEYKHYLQWTAIKNGYLDFDVNDFSGKEYHIDHIVPCSWFNLSDPSQQKDCFNFRNTQILKAEENDRKGNKRYA
jgi:hypothetical protein